ncbi:c-type cytochrome [Sphingomonas quercus]|uniref:Cytochrome c n=1 Tax=Sphingomonas quercus TaxID=2842451 RepID=A0ABS6BJT5_9SPHN|nr:cytochrome c [Sphingomonas quercus]MBU3078554.1 cytochrome c [Sphingomonas quercus]
MKHPIRVATGVVCTVAAVAGIVTAANAQRRGGYNFASGKDIYEHVCQGCHMADAKGAQGAGAYPGLASNRKLQTPLYPVLIVLRGQKAMPSFSALSDEQVVEVVNYIRTNFGNSYPNAVTLDQVKGLRARAVQQQAQRPG